MTDESYHLIGVMGSPVMHSQSPLMHNYWFDQTGLPGKYVYLPLPPERLPAALRALPALNFAGCNLTIPHKLQAMEIVDEVDEVARKIGAISCVVVLEDGSLLGTNNDWLGFLGNLKQSAPDWRANAGPATVIGAGGGSRAVCHALLSEGVQEIRLVNRSNDRAQRLADDIGGPIMVLSWNERHAALDGAATVVNTTSLGMVGSRLWNSSSMHWVLTRLLQTSFTHLSKHHSSKRPAHAATQRSVVWACFYIKARPHGNSGSA